MSLEKSKNNLKNASDELEIREKIGEGCQGCVYNTIHKKVNLFAVKVVNSQYMTEKERKRLKREIKINELLKKSNFFPCLQNQWNNGSYSYLLFQKCGESVKNLLKKKRTLTQSYSMGYVMLFDILKALEQLEKMSVIHRDITIGNILFDNGRFKLCDFGLARIFEGRRMSTGVGSIMSKAPEIYEGFYSTKADVWSLAVSSYWVAYQTLPFDSKLNKAISTKNVGEAIDRFSQGLFTINTDNNSTSFNIIINSMLQIDQSQRFSASQILKQYFNPQIDSRNDNYSLKSLLNQYLGSRWGESGEKEEDYYLILLLLFIDYSKTEKKIKKVENPVKKSIYASLQLSIYLFLNFLIKKISNETSLGKQFISFYQKLKSQLNEFRKDHFDLEISSPNEVLHLYKSQKVVDKFPGLLYAIKIYQQISNNEESKIINLWDLPLNLRKLKI